MQTFAKNPKPKALLRINIPNVEPLVTPEKKDNNNKDCQNAVRHAGRMKRKRQNAVAINPSINGVEALSTELQTTNNTALTRSKQKPIKKSQLSLCQHPGVWKSFLLRTPVRGASTVIYWN